MMRKLSALLALLLLPTALAADNVVAIKDVKIYTVSGKPIAKGTVLIRSGKIAEIGRKVAVPFGATVVRGAGKVLIPGMVIAHTFSGTDNPNENVPVTPYVSTVDSVDPSSRFFETQLRRGITSVAVYPGNRSAVAGQGIVVKIRSKTVHGMLLRRTLALKVSFSGRGSRMMVMSQIRKAFKDAIEQRKKLKESAKKASEALKKKPTDAKLKKIAEDAAKKKPSFKVQPLLDATDGKLPVLFYCNRPGDVLRAIDLVGEFKLKHSTLLLGGTAFQARAAIARQKLKVVLDPGAVYREIDPDTGRETLHPVAKLLRKSGLTFALTAAAGRSGGGVAQQLWYEAAMAVKWGLSREDALKAITLWPAQQLGLGKRIGSIEKGKDADLVLLSGEPFSVRTVVEQSWIDGKSSYRRDKDQWLDRLYYRKKQQ